MNTNEHLNYPVKYAIMPIVEITGWNTYREFEKEYDIVANIVMKCYLINKTKTYFGDGTSETKYEVVFLYDRKNPDYLDQFETVIPRYNLTSQKCTNSIFVNQIFDNFKEALTVAEIENEKVFDNQLVKKNIF